MKTLAVALAAAVGLVPGPPARAVPLAREGRVQGTAVTYLDYRTTVPAGWAPRTPTSRMRLGEFVVAPKDGAPGAEVIVYFFGIGQGGSVQANLVRWKGQFSNPDGSPVFEKVTRDSSSAFPITFAEYHGTYARGVGMGPTSGQAFPNYALVVGIAETPRGTLFIQLVGPVSRVKAEREVFVRFVKGLNDSRGR